MCERESGGWRGTGVVRGTESDSGVLTIKDEPSLSSIFFLRLSISAYLLPTLF